QPRADHGLSAMGAAERSGPGDPQGDGAAVTPKVPEVIAAIAGLIARSLVPGGDPADVGANLGPSAALLGLAAQRIDGMVQALVEENRAVRTLLARGAGLIGDDGSAVLSRGADENFRISALERTNAELLDALLALHERVEHAQCEAARALEA